MKKARQRSDTGRWVAADRWVLAALALVTFCLKGRWPKTKFTLLLSSMFTFHTLLYEYIHIIFNIFLFKILVMLRPFKFLFYFFQKHSKFYNIIHYSWYKSWSIIEAKIFPYIGITFTKFYMTDRIHLIFSFTHPILHLGQLLLFSNKSHRKNWKPSLRTRWP